MTSLIRQASLTFALVALAAACFASAAHAADPALAKGDRIVFLGDSITQAGAGPGGYVTLVRESLAKTHKDLGIEVIGAGISGNKVPDLQGRLERDVLSKKPTIVVIYIGINDVWHSESGRGTPKEKFDAGLRDIIKKINDVGARVILCTPTLIGEKHDGSNKLDAMLDEYSEVSRKVAADTKSQLLDLRKICLAHVKAHNPENAERGILTSDRVHLNAAGNRFLADQMLVALGAAPASPAPKTSAPPTGNSKEKGMLRHIVLFKFKADATPAQVQEIVTAFQKLPKQIDAIAGFEWGTDVSPEMKSEGYTHCFVVTFKDAAGRDAYLPHPAHEVFKKLVGPRLEKVLVVDFFVQP